MKTIKRPFLKSEKQDEKGVLCLDGYPVKIFKIKNGLNYVYEVRCENIKIFRRSVNLPGAKEIAYQMAAEYENLLIWHDQLA